MQEIKSKMSIGLFFSPYLFYFSSSAFTIHDEPIQLACAGDHVTLTLSGLDTMHVGYVFVKHWRGWGGVGWG